MIGADVLCEHCRYRLAAGDLDGRPLCLECVLPVLERWIATEVDPYLETHLPDLLDDPFLHV